MSIRKMALVAALGLSMASAPVMAQTSAPTVAERTGATLDEANGQYASTTTYIVAFFVILAIGLGIYTALNDDEDGRTSP